MSNSLKNPGILWLRKSGNPDIVIQFDAFDSHILANSSFSTFDILGIPNSFLWASTFIDLFIIAFIHCYCVCSNIITFTTVCSWRPGCFSIRDMAMNKGILQ